MGFNSGLIWFNGDLMGINGIGYMMVYPLVMTNMANT